MIINTENRVLLLSTIEDKSYIKLLAGSLRKYNYTGSISLKVPASKKEIVTLGYSKILCTQEALIPKVCSTASEKEQKLSNYAGSLIKISEEPLVELLFLPPLKQYMSLAYGKFLIERYLDKFVRPEIFYGL